MALVALILGPLCAIACDRDQRRLSQSGCAVCGLLGYAVGVNVTRELGDQRRLATCGRCADGQRCNLLEEPPRCAPDPGVAGARCGSVGRIAYTCGEGLRCLARGGPAVCVALPGEGDLCDYAGSYRGECARGLTCASDERCRRLCPDCPRGSACSPIEEPPRCVAQPLPVGARCGRYARGDGGAHSTWYACAGVCVARGGVARCEAPNPAWQGPRCGTHPCPDGTRCDVTVCVPR